MVQLFEEVRREGVPDAFSNGTIRRHRQRELARDSAFGPIIREITEAHVSGSDVVHLFVAHPLAAFQRALEVSEPFRKFVADAFARSTTVRIALYSDEVTPGQALQGHQRRKVQCVYWTMLEFGYPALGNESAWFTASVMRSTEVAKLQGGLNRLFKVVLGFMFGTQSGIHNTVFDLRRGVVFELERDKPPMLLHGGLGMIVQDALAHKELGLTKGASGNHFCPLCQNVVRHRCLQLPDPTGFLIPGTSVDVMRFMLHSSNTVKEVLRRLEAIALGGDRADLETMETDFGFSYCPGNVFLDEHLDLDLPGTLVFDCNCGQL